MVGESRWSQIGKYVLVAVVSLIVLLPVYWMINMSFKGKAEFVARPPTIVVQQPTTENYYDLLVTQRFYRYGINSLLVALIAATISVTVGTLAAYALSRYRLPRNFNYHLLFTMLTVRMFPPIVLTIPLYPIFNSLGLIDTVTAIVLPGAARLYSAPCGLACARRTPSASARAPRRRSCPSSRSRSASAGMASSRRPKCARSE